MLLKKLVLLLFSLLLLFFSISPLTWILKYHIMTEQKTMTSFGIRVWVGCFKCFKEHRDYILLMINTFLLSTTDIKSIYNTITITNTLGKTNTVTQI